MNNNDIFKKLRVALMLRDDQIIEILELVDFRMSKGEIGNFFRNQDHPNYMECGDQVLRNFLNGLIIYKRGKFVVGVVFVAEHVAESTFCYFEID